jgi:hypothetical protein
MLTLAISQEMLEIMPDRARVVVVATMLWPNNEKMRYDAIHFGATDYVNAVREATHGPDDVVSVDSKTIAWMNSAPCIGDLAGGNVRAKGGDIAGRILIECLSGHRTGRPVGLQTVKADIEKHLKLAGPNRGTGPHAKKVSTVVEDAWKAFRPVAHLWAANLMTGAHVSDIMGFLARAESIRQQGEGLKTKYSREAVLPPGAAWRVPDDVRLPRGQVGFRRIARGR